MVKVMHIIGGFGVGGAQKVVIDYLRQLKHDSDYDVIALSTVGKQNTEFEKILDEEKLPVIFLEFDKSKNKIHFIRLTINYLNYIKHIYISVKNFNPDIVHTHITPIFKLVLLPILFLNVKYKVHTLHSNPYTIHKLDKFLAILAFRFCAFLPICLNEEQVIRAQKVYGSFDYHIIRNGVNLNAFYIEKAKGVLRREYAFKEDAFIVGSIARFHPVKNHVFMINVFKEIIKFHNNAILVLVGDGTEKNHIEELVLKLNIQDQVYFMGNRNDIPQILKMLDVFLLTSFSEASPVSVIEAQAAGIKCVVSNAIPENCLLQENSIRLSLNESAKIWAEVILNNKKYRENKQEEILNYSIDSSVKELKELYKNIMSKQKER